MDPALDAICAAYSFAMGAIVASFLNVVIWRVPRGESIVSPPSHCPKCGARIRWWQNVPIVSWLALRGKCAKCREPISPRYLLVELLGGVLFFAAYLKFGLFAPVLWVWLALMIVGSFVDFDLQLLPDFVTVGGMVYGVVVSAGCWALMRFGLWSGSLPGCAAVPVPTPLMSLIGLAFGFGLLWLVRFVGTMAFKREAMGMGDVFLMGAVGAIFGPIAVLFTLIASSVVGSVVGLGLMAMSKVRIGKFVAIPYGPYICLGCLAWMFAGPELVRLYLRALGA